MLAQSRGAWPALLGVDDLPGKGCFPGRQRVDGTHTVGKSSRAPVFPHISLFFPNLTSGRWNFYLEFPPWQIKTDLQSNFPEILPLRLILFKCFMHKRHLHYCFKYSKL